MKMRPKVLTMVLALVVAGYGQSNEAGSTGVSDNDSPQFSGMNSHRLSGRTLSLIFKDDFESGNTTKWSVTMPPPDTPNCNCYFSGDCNSGMFCDWGPAGPFTEDICNWRVPKPNGVPGGGCNIDHEGGPGPICDGYCSPSSNGSIFGHEEPELVIAAIQIWTRAMMEPALAGGGPMAADLAEEALNLPFKNPDAALLAGRHVADMLSLSVGLVFYEFFCHFEYHPNEPGNVIDLSGDPCRYEAGRLTMEALVAEMSQPGDAAAIVNRIPTFCPDWSQMFGPRCPSGPQSLNCLLMRIEGAARFLTIPTQYM